MPTTNTFTSVKALLKESYPKKHGKDCNCSKCKK